MSNDTASAGYIEIMRLVNEMDAQGGRFKADVTTGLLAYSSGKIIALRRPRRQIRWLLRRMLRAHRELRSHSERYVYCSQRIRCSMALSPDSL